MKIQLFTAVAAVAAGWISFAPADYPAADDKPIVEVVEQLEQQGYGPFSELEFDNGNWEVEAFRQGSKRELHVHPETGEIISDRLDD